MDIETMGVRGKLQAALLAAFNLDGDTNAPAGADAAASAITDVLCRFGEVVAAAVVPVRPIVEGIAMDSQASDSAKLPFWMADIAARALCHRAVPNEDGKTLGEVGTELTAALLALDARTAPR